MTDRTVTAGTQHTQLWPNKKRRLRNPVPVSTSPLLQKLLSLHDQAKSVLGHTMSVQAAKLGRLVQLDMDIMAWEGRLVDRPEMRQLRDGRRDLGFAIYAASSGLYVQAYASLRLFVELSFAAVYFSANELHRRRWISDRADFSWSKALDESEGILTKAFVREFSEVAAEDSVKYAESAAKCYRHCSQFVHGKVAVTDSIPATLAFSNEVLDDWLRTALESGEAVLYLLYSRYGDELLPTDNGSLATILESWFSHLRSVRKVIGLPVEEAGS